VNCAQTADLIKIFFEVGCELGWAKKALLDGVLIPMQRGNFGGKVMPDDILP